MIKEHKNHNYRDVNNNISRIMEIIDINYDEKLYYNLSKENDIYTLNQIDKATYKSLLKK